MDKKGFTLIELLAVIVILAIISVIALPKILNVVEEAKKGSAEASALGYIDAVEKQIMINATSHSHDEITDGTYEVPLEAKYGVTVKGKAPADGEIVIENGKVKTYSIVVDGYTISFDGTTKSVTKTGSSSEPVATCSYYSTNEVVLEETTPNQYTFKPKCTGNYKLEVWGASGNIVSATYANTGYGGYSVGTIRLIENVDVYAVVGGVGNSGIATLATGGYNGGGDGKDYSDGRGSGSGGGATHIAYEPGLLSTLGQYKGTLKNNSYYESERIIIVAGGGGGVGNFQNKFTISLYGGHGGGKTGVDGIAETYLGTGGTQTAGGIVSDTTWSVYSGTNGDFGVGGTCKDSAQGNCSGGGGGFYGGGSNYNYSGAGGGGSGYIANSNLTNKKMVVYANDNSYVSNDTETKTELTNQYSETAESNKAKKGNGAVKITYLG